MLVIFLLFVVHFSWALNIEVDIDESTTIRGRIHIDSHARLNSTPDGLSRHARNRGFQFCELERHGITQFFYTRKGLGICDNQDKLNFISLLCLKKI